jgi:hypothetical protein
MTEYGTRVEWPDDVGYTSDDMQRFRDRHCVDGEITVNQTFAAVPVTILDVNQYGITTKHAQCWQRYRTVTR